MNSALSLPVCALAGLIGSLPVTEVRADPFPDVVEICRTAHENPDQASSSLKNSGWAGVSTKELEPSLLRALVNLTIQQSGMQGRYRGKQRTVRYFANGDDALKFSHWVDNESWKFSTATIQHCDLVLQSAEANAFTRSLKETVRAAFGNTPDAVRISWFAENTNGHTVFFLNSPPIDDNAQPERAIIQIGFFSTPTFKGETND